MPKNAWNGMPANSSSIRIRYPGRCGPGSTPMIGQKKIRPTAKKCTIIATCPTWEPIRKSNSGVKYSAYRLAMNIGMVNSGWVTTRM
ncbi:hypothetical protein SHIRM173S_11326 [Streptomyces hirsutus]